MRTSWSESPDNGFTVEDWTRDDLHDADGAPRARCANGNRADCECDAHRWARAFAAATPLDTRTSRIVNH